ncbi:hypothetical protein NBRC111894_1708 [Sporolactobacillus inulinus]|uniref:Uncharacterized protein n=1 Tax=Sporolactobacillus inulinus TaxID=2078 RepID=A0A4Y1ZAX8_9BACL|nr:hypothetical protein NBRC111894_1708 [Sporolactobacillus inulinus]
MIASIAPKSLLFHFWFILINVLHFSSGTIHLIRSDRPRSRSVDASSLSVVRAQH